MKARVNQYALFLLALCFTACSSRVYVEQDNSVNLNNYRTYSWVETRDGENDNSARPMAYADLSVRNAAAGPLQARGWTESDASPDLILSYDVVVERSRERRSDPVYSQPFTRSYFNPFTRRWGYIYYPSQFMGYQSYTVPVREGTLTITITDARTDKTVWQGWTTERTNYSRFTDAQLKRAVEKILKKLNG